MNEFFRTNPAEFDLRVQLNTGLEEMPIENAQVEWSESASRYQTVARLVIPHQVAWYAVKDGYFEDLTFSPAHTLEAHRPLGSINRARLFVYGLLASRRLSDNGKSAELPTNLEQVPS